MGVRVGDEMVVRKRIEISLKTRQTLVIRSPRGGREYWCSECVEPSRMVTPDEAAVLSETSAREIYRLIENGGLHFIETDYGLVLVCFNSLPGTIGASLQKGIQQQS